MTVYVDNAAHAFGRMKMCHCWADSRDELFDMMRKIGVQLKWFQRPAGDCEFGMDASWEHFDISQSKRALAIQNGAIATCKYTMSEHANRQKFLKALERGQYDRMIYPLRMMCMAASVRKQMREITNA